ncbi:MAG: MinD/ParA family ATP-binding protein [Candidatus Asgardarchaeia archaeon]
MAKRISVHSFRGGTGKSNLVANFATLMAKKGRRVATVDLDLKAPGLHVIFEVPPENLKWKLNDYLFKRCSASEVVTDLTSHLGLDEGALYFIPASFKLDDLLKIIEEGYEISYFNQGLRKIIEDFKLDYIYLDTHPGIDEDTILAITMSEVILEVMRADQQDLTGTYMTLLVSKKLGKKIHLLLNMVPKGLEGVVSELVEKSFEQPVLDEIPFVEDVIAARSKGVFALKHPDHPFTKHLERVADKLLNM